MNPEGPYWKDNDTKSIPEPEYKEPNLNWTTVKRTTFDQWHELLDVDRNVRKIFGNPTQAKNTNAFDEVPNSSWFTNRHGYPATRLIPEQITEGSLVSAGPDTSGYWEVFRLKVKGATPGFWIEDSRSNQYIIKFDPYENPEMGTAAAAIGSRYFYACGYNVPQETIVYWRPEKLRIRAGETFKDPDGTIRPLTLDDVEEILGDVNLQPDGTIRSLASLNLGNVKGPFMFTGTRSDDPNDWCPHQHRRELRGLYVTGSLVNHYDLKDHNTMDVYIENGESRYLKHYLIDFGSCLGSDGRSVKHPKKGYANSFDLRDVGVSTVILGLKTWKWENSKPHQYTSVGYFESELFEPDKFDPINPNPAFEQLTDQDGYWGAKIVMSFRDEDLRALVKSGQLSDPEAEQYLLETLIARRDKIGRYWFNKVNSLDYPHASKDDTSWVIDFEDLAVMYGLEKPTATYQYEVSFDGKVILGSATTKESYIVLSPTDFKTLEAAVESAKAINSIPIELRIWTHREGQLQRLDETVFLLHFQQDNDILKVVGIEHPS